MARSDENRPDAATLRMARRAHSCGVAHNAASRSWYDPRWHYEREAETRAALDLIASGHFSPGEPELFRPLHDGLLLRGEPYMHLADLAAYLEADRRLTELWAQPEEWVRKAILNVSASGRFSSDRAIAEYASEIWNLRPCPVP